MENIALFCDVKELLRLRNVNAKARKVIERVVKDKRVVIAYFSGVKGSILNSRVWYKDGATIAEGKVEKSVANYIVREKQDLAEIEGEELFCSLDLEFRIKSKLTFERVDSMKVDLGNWKYYLNCCFNKVDCLSVNNLKSDQIKEILSRIKKVTKVKMLKCVLNSILTRFTADKLFLKKCKIEDLLELKGIKVLEMVKCDDIHNLISRSTICLSIEGIEKQDFSSWFGSFQKLKEFSITCNKLTTPISAFPPCLMHLKLFECTQFDLTALNSFKSLRTISAEEVNFPIPNKSLKSLETDAIEEKCLNPQIKLKNVTINSENSAFFNKNPIFLAELASISVDSTDFSFDNLPFGLTKASLMQFDYSSQSLTRS